jgi:Putative transposase/Transposase zinc-binding domain
MSTVLHAFSSKELDCDQSKSLKALLLKDDAWWRYYQKHKESLRPEVVETISNLLSCGLSGRGVACYECPNPNCTHTKKIAFTCHNRFCPRCGKKATEQWISRQLSILPSCNWQHITLTMPKEFWRFFKENWALLNKLPKLAGRLLQRLGQLKGVVPGIFIALHTFGRDLKDNPHLHASTTQGGLNQKETQFKGSYFKKKLIMKMWRYAVIRLLKKAYKEGLLILPEGLNSLCPDLRSFSAWLNRRLHKPWIVHVAKPTPNPMRTLNYLGRYLKRPPVSQSRLRHYDGKRVVFNFLNHRTDKHQLFRCSTEEFIRRFIQHIPTKNFRMVRYYGFLANRVRGEKLPLVRELLGQEAKPEPYRLRYAELMQKTFGVNPRSCILCQSEMQLVYLRVGANSAFFHSQHEQLAQGKKVAA